MEKIAAIRSLDIHFMRIVLLFGVREGGLSVEIELNEFRFSLGVYSKTFLFRRLAGKCLLNRFPCAALSWNSKPRYHDASK